MKQSSHLRKQTTTKTDLFRTLLEPNNTPFPDFLEQRTDPCCDTQGHMGNGIILSNMFLKNEI